MLKFHVLLLARVAPRSDCAKKIFEIHGRGSIHIKLTFMSKCLSIMCYYLHGLPHARLSFTEPNRPSDTPLLQGPSANNMTINCHWIVRFQTFSFPGLPLEGRLCEKWKRVSIVQIKDSLDKQNTYLLLCRPSDTPLLRASLQTPWLLTVIELFDSNTFVPRTTS